MEKIESLDGFITEFGGIRDKWFHRKEYIKRDENFLDKMDAFIDAHDNTDIYYCVYNYENENIETCKLLGSLYLDFDGSIESEETFEEVRRETLMAVNYFATYWSIPINMIEIYFSGNKGFHIVIPWQILGLQPDAELNVKFKMIAKLVAKQCNAKHVDMGIYDRKRLFRIPGSINKKSGLYKVPLSYSQLMEFSLQEIIDWAREPRDYDIDAPQLVKKSAEHYKEVFRREKLKAKLKQARKKKEFKIPEKRKKLLPCVVEILKTGAAKGQRNNTTVALASSLMQSGVKRDEVEDIILDWNQANEPPLSESEIVTTISSAYRTLSNGMGYGCQTFKDLGYCVGKTCKIANK